MKGYRSQVYMAAPWGRKAAVLSNSILGELDRRGYTVVGDHAENKSRVAAGEGGWQARCDFTMRACAGVVAVLEVRDSDGRISPFILPELLLAARHGLPLLIIFETGARVSSPEAGVLEFLSSVGPGVRAEPYPHLGPEYVALTSDDFKDDAELQAISQLSLAGVSPLVGPTEYSGGSLGPHLEHSLDVFCKSLKPDRERLHVFHVTQFRRVAEHEVIARTVFEETGLECVLAPDGLGASDSLRDHWWQELTTAELVIADLSGKSSHCVFEVGVAIGTGRPLKVVHRERKPSFVFGLDDHEFRRYRSLPELAGLVREFVAGHRRDVKNLTVLGVDSRENLKGVPQWVCTPPESGGPLEPLTIGSILGLCGVALFGLAAWDGEAGIMGAVAAVALALVAGANFTAHLAPVLGQAVSRSIDRKPWRFVFVCSALLLAGVLALALKHFLPAPSELPPDAQPAASDSSTTPP